MSAVPAPATLGEALRQAAHRAPAAPALVGDFGSLSWAELAASARQVAVQLRRLAATHQRDLAAPAAPPRPHALSLRPDRDDVIVLLAHALAGIPLLPLHPALPEGEARRLAAAAGARWLSLAQCMEPPAGGAAVAHGEADAGRAVQPADDLFLVPTSGSAGAPKLARLSHRAVLAAAAALNERLPFGAADRWILTLPLAHVGGLSVLARCICAVRPVVLVPQFHEDAIWLALARDGGTRLSAVPAMAHRLLAADRDGRLRRLSLLMLGGQAAPLALRQALAAAGVAAVASYGLTESCAAAACEAPADAERLRAGCGSALRGVAIHITDAAGQAQPVGTPGQIRLAGPALLTGYAAATSVAAELPAACAAVAAASAVFASPFDTDGRLDTGDLGWLDDAGRLHVQGRRAEVIVTGGEKVVPGVVEAALREHPAVRDAVVFGLADERWGAIVCAAVEGPAALAADATLPALMATLLPPWARPRQLAVFDTLPRLNTGKVDRRGTPALAAPRLQAWPAPRAGQDGAA